MRVIAIHPKLSIQIIAICISAMQQAVIMAKAVMVYTVMSILVPKADVLCKRLLIPTIAHPTNVCIPDAIMGVTVMECIVIYTMIKGVHKYDLL